MDRYMNSSIASESTPVFNPTRAALPLEISGISPGEMPSHPHVVPISRLEVPTHSSTATTTSSSSSSNRNNSGSGSNLNNSATITTTYQVRTDPSRDLNTRDGTRPRRSTIENHSRPISIPISVTQRERPIVHNTPTSINPENIHHHHHHPHQSFASSEYTTMPPPPPAWPEQNQQQQQYHWENEYNYSDVSGRPNIDIERGDGLRIRTGGGVVSREPMNVNPRSQPQYTPNLSRPSETLVDVYGEDGYGYTNPRDLVQYDLDHSYRAASEFYPDHNGFEDKKSRPKSIGAYDDLVVPRSYDKRERGGPPPSTRGFDKIRSDIHHDVSSNHRTPLSPAQPRFSTIESVDSSRQRPSSHNGRELRIDHKRDEFYETRDRQKREKNHHEHYDDGIEVRGFGIRSDRSERPDRSEKVERSRDRSDLGHKDHREHRGRDVLATGLSIAGAALGLTAVRNASRDEHRNREDHEARRRRRRKERDDNRRYKDRVDVESVDSSGRDSKRESKERTHENNSSRKIIRPRETVLPAETKSRENREPSKSSRDERPSEPVRHERRRHHSRLGHSASSSSDDVVSRSKRDRSRKDHHQRNHMTSTTGFNPNDTSDLKALQHALNLKDSEPRGISHESSSRKSKETNLKKDNHEVRNTNNDNNSSERDPKLPIDNKPPRVVSPPRENIDEKPPVKGILRQPRDKFPEDPSPIREGVAPLKDAKKDGIPPDARWTKISRRLVNPEALEIGKERFEARDDFVIVLRVLTKDEVQAYADLTQKIRSSHEEEYEKVEASKRHEAHRAHYDQSQVCDGSSSSTTDIRGRRRGQHNSESEFESDSLFDSDEDTATDGEEGYERVSSRISSLEGTNKKKSLFQDDLMSGGLGDSVSDRDDLREVRGASQYNKYLRNPHTSPPIPAPMPPPLTGLRKELR